ncbi:TetR/AcrR family transcriptional regulator [Paenibacillus sp. MSJ-34]|uniref:TetR/AcrR family transcriptional regulator n=1 Tax=Paenibacillus sp. MSJ-34 TaxID=2841529 RepID=UPI001C0FE668|nr:TetR/AcrR family transcriptional regulator [Paenibacillus sp. MSJ-34]MBU5443000.1 TetR/AcrR family transcriptional regulator [Paenibacillus sp. MSJ-34]
MARRRPEETEQTKSIIIQCAKELFSQKGYGAVSMEEIRIRSGISKGSIYYHFKSKEQLFITLLDINMNEWIDKWNAISAPLRTETERLYRLAEHFADDFNNPLMKAGEEFAGSRGADPEVLESILRISYMPRPIFIKVLQDGMNGGEFKEDDTDKLTDILFGMLAGVGSTLIREPSYDKVVALHRKAIDVFLNGIKP